MGKKRRKKQYGRLRGDSGQQRRTRIVAWILSAVVFLPCGIQLYRLMIVQYDFYRQKALDNQTRTTNVAPVRGNIYDCNMQLLAYNEDRENVYLNPHRLRQFRTDIGEMARTLAPLVNKEASWIEAQAKDTSMRYKQIAAGVDRETATAIRAYIAEHQIDGIHLEPAVQRSYPYGSLAGQVLGFVNSSNEGAEGVEAAYNGFLQGGMGKTISSTGNNETNMPYPYEAYLAGKQGCDVVLTLDITVQACLEKQMAAAIDRYDVQNGAFGMVMDAQTGAILAMATLGGYDPNVYNQIADQEKAAELEQLQQAYLSYEEGSAAYEEGKKKYNEELKNAQLKQWRNRCISDGYEPGSTFKLMTLAAALDTGAVSLTSSFHCGGAEHIAGRSQLLHCWRSTGHGPQQTPQALQNSCNLAFAHIALSLGGDRFYEYVTRFGILEKTGIDLYGESKGVFFDRSIVTDTDKWGTASLTSGSFGQTFKLTPLQLVRAVAAVVNGGYLLEPYVVSEVLDAQGRTVLKQEPTVLRQVISEETSRTMCTLMESVVTEGTAKNAKVYGFSIGGKTGTSEKIDVLDESGNPTLDKIVSFIGVAPMDHPRYIVLVALDTPSRKTGLYISGGVMAAPTVGAVLADILPYLGVAPAYPEEDAAAQQITVADYTGLTKQEVAQKLKEQQLTAVLAGTAQAVTAQIPAPGTVISGDSELMLYFGPQPDIEYVTVPDFWGLNHQQALEKASAAGLYMLPRGNDSGAPTVKVTMQSHAKDTQVPRGTVITLTFTDTNIQN